MMTDEGSVGPVAESPRITQTPQSPVVATPRSGARPDTLRENCRANVMAIFDTCKAPSRPSCISFEPEDVERLASPEPMEEDLGDLVQNLHELSTFFQDEGSLSSRATHNLHTPLATPVFPVRRANPGIRSFSPSMFHAASRDSSMDPSGLPVQNRWIQNQMRRGATTDVGQALLRRRSL